MHISISLYASLGFCFWGVGAFGVNPMAISSRGTAGDRLRDFCNSGDLIFILVAYLYRFTDLLGLFARVNVVT